jgi:hypothetical protein
MIALGAFAGLIRMALRSSQLPRRWKTCLGNASLVGFALGSPLLLLLGNLSIYDEAIIWGLAWSLAALYFALRAGEAQDAAALTWSLAAFSFCAGAALLSRATFGAPFLLIAPVLAFRLIRKNLIRNGAALFLPLGAAFVFYLFLTYARFGALEGMPMRYSTNTEQREFAMKHGLFRPERIPYSFADYFVLRVPRPQREPPYLEGSRQPCDANLYVMPFTETYSSLLWCSSWIVLGAAVGMAQLLRPGGFDWANDCRRPFFGVPHYLILHGTRAAVRRRVFPVSRVLLCGFPAPSQCGLPAAPPDSCFGCCFSSDKLALDGLMVARSRPKCACSHKGEME